MDENQQNPATTPETSMDAANSSAPNEQNQEIDSSAKENLSQEENDKKAVESVVEKLKENFGLYNQEFAELEALKLKCIVTYPPLAKGYWRLWTSDMNQIFKLSANFRLRINKIRDASKKTG